MTGKKSLCLHCKKESGPIPGFLGVCARCVKRDFHQVFPLIRKAHAASQERFNLPTEPPADPAGLSCDFCVNECRMGEGDRGFCGLRGNKKGKLTGPRANKGYLSWYHDLLPTNCVASWVCPGGTNSGYPEFSYSKGAEYTYTNLAVFFHGCGFNCLFCQNWHFREYMENSETASAADLSRAVDNKTACICYFGGDPSPQLPYALKASRMALEQTRGRILRICWETNGSMNPRFLEKMLAISLKSGGCIKFDLKAWDEKLHLALCGMSNKRTLENFALAAEKIKQRREPPLLVASTLLVPGYIDEEEVSRLARFIAGLDPSIPYALLGFGPQFNMSDLPRTSAAHAQRCLQAALDAGLQRVRIGNSHLLGAAY